MCFVLTFSLWANTPAAGTLKTSHLYNALIGPYIRKTQWKWITYTLMPLPLLWPSVVSNYLCVTLKWFVSLHILDSSGVPVNLPTWVSVAGTGTVCRDRALEKTLPPANSFPNTEDHTTRTINTRYTIRHTQKTHTLSRTYSLQDLRETRIHHHPQQAGDKPLLIHTSRWLVDVYEAKRQNFLFSPWQLN